MNYKASLTDFFKSPKWRTNLLLSAVTILIPVVGPLVLGGWHITCLWARGNRHNPAEFPPYEFELFGKYLERGLWPFLVGMVASLAFVPVFLIVILPLFLLTGMMVSNSGNQGSGGLYVAAFIGIFCLQLLLQIAVQAITTPLMVRAAITQDFKYAFSLRFLKSFLALTWKELLISMLFMLGVGLGLMVLAVVTCYIGAIFAAPVALFGWHHLQKQLYQLYLSRGGEPVPLSPKLRDLPPPLPLAVP